MVRSLINRFKEFRRPKKPRTATKTLVSRARKAPGIINSVKQPVPPPGEDAVSYERHTKVLQTEFKKTNNNALVCGKIMRRAEILENNYSLTALLSRFPFLQETDQVIFTCTFIL